MKEVFQKIKTESKESAYELIQRKMFYDSGFHNCYVARTADTNELCHINWLLSSEDNNVRSRGFRSQLPRLKEDELLVENFFTFEKYRGNRLMASVIGQSLEMARSKGFKRMITDAYG